MGKVGGGGKRGGSIGKDPAEGTTLRTLSSNRALLVCSDCYNRIPWTSWLVNNRNSYILETESPR